MARGGSAMRGGGARMLNNNQLDERPKRGVTGMTLGDIPKKGGGTFNDDTPPLPPKEEGHGEGNKSNDDSNKGGGR